MHRNPVPIQILRIRFILIVPACKNPVAEPFDFELRADRLPKLPRGVAKSIIPLDGGLRQSAPLRERAMCAMANCADQRRARFRQTPPDVRNTAFRERFRSILLPPAMKLVAIVASARLRQRCKLPELASSSFKFPSSDFLVPAVSPVAFDSGASSEHNYVYVTPVEGKQARRS
jgi:hypothetical protein